MSGLTHIRRVRGESCNNNENKIIKDIFVIIEILLSSQFDSFLLSLTLKSGYLLHRLVVSISGKMLTLQTRPAQCEFIWPGLLVESCWIGFC